MTKQFTHFIYLALALILLVGCNKKTERSNTAEVLTRSDEYVYEPVVRGEPVEFPRDYGAHPEYRTEWWYLTANVKSPEGKEFGIQWTLFRMATSTEKETGWKTPQMYMAHAVITSKSKVWSAERFARGGIGQAGVTSTPYHAWLDNWSWKALGKTPFPGMVEFADDGMAAVLKVTQHGPIVLQGDQGYSKKHPELDMASRYFSAPFLDIDGKITLDGTEYQVSGEAWLDREWSSSMLAKDQLGWDWFSIHLNDGSALMVSQLREKDDLPYYFGSRSWPNGKVVQLDHTQIRLTPLSYTRIDGKKFPLQWRIDVPSQNIKLTVNVLRKDQWLPFVFPYWEGPIHVTGSHSGQGFMELTGY
ncbi:lipocalin-like domain-containing protein [Photobacterium damselae]